MRKTSEAAWLRFRGNVDAIGGVVLEQSWLGARTPHRIRCGAGHETTAMPNNVDSGQAICVPCTGKDKGGAWGRFVAAVEQQGGRVLEEAWKGSQTYHRIRCAVGHESDAQPNKVQQGAAACRACSGVAPEFAWGRFVAAVEQQGGRVLEDAWKGAHTHHGVRCRQGHESTVTPTQVAMGCGFCGPCRGAIHDVFYVVAGAGVVKFGITSGDPRPRLGNHKRDGLTTQLFLREGLPDGHARNLELSVMHALQRMGCEPLRGREYFPLSCKNTILPLVRAALPE